MLMSDRSIRMGLKDGSIFIEPQPADSAFQPASVDVRLGNKFRVFDAGVQLIDPASGEDYTTEIELPKYGEGHGVFILPVGGFALAHTMETIGCGRSVAGQIDGKSTLGRLGLGVHSTAGFLDPGWLGQVTLELHSHAPAPIALRPGMLIGQVLFWRLSKPSDRVYGAAELGSRYQGSVGPIPARSVNPRPIQSNPAPDESATIAFDGAYQSGPVLIIEDGRPAIHPREAPMTITRAERERWGV